MVNDTPKVKILTIGRSIATLCCICYVWSLPLLAKVGFAQKGQNSLSGFIANPQATGALAMVSFVPIVMMWEYQDIIINLRKKEKNIKNKLNYSISMFQLSYGLFLTCTDGFAPSWLHMTTVICFGTSCIIHSILILRYIEFTKISKMLLQLGIFTFLILPFVPGLYFWAIECVGFSIMMIFTPLECYFLHTNFELYDEFINGSSSDTALLKVIKN